MLFQVKTDGKTQVGCKGSLSRSNSCTLFYIFACQTTLKHYKNNKIDKKKRTEKGHHLASAVVKSMLQYTQPIKPISFSSTDLSHVPTAPLLPFHKMKSLRERAMRGLAAAAKKMENVNFLATTDHL